MVQNIGNPGHPGNPKPSGYHIYKVLSRQTPSRFKSPDSLVMVEKENLLDKPIPSVLFELLYPVPFQVINGNLL